jgi:imidazolonepropionase-like amidohydrolase
MRRSRRLLPLPALLSLSCLACLSCAGTSSPPPPVAPSFVPPPSSPSPSAAAAPDVTVRYDVILGDHVAGKSVVLRHADKSYDEDFELNDRGRGPKVHTHVEVGLDGMPTRVELSGKDYFKRDVRELATCDKARCKWDSDDEHGEGAHGFYVPANATFGIDGLLFASMTRSGAPVQLLPGGFLQAKKVADATVVHGGETKHLNAYELAGSSFVPGIEWFEDDGTTFGTVSDSGATVPEGWGDVVPNLLAVQRPLAQAWRERVTKQVTHHPATLAVVHARLFDSATKKVTPDATVVIEGGKVKAVGPKLAAPKDAEVIDAHGMTMLPGLWDMHVHLGDEDGLMDLAEGVTTVRDLGTEMTSAIERRARWDAGGDAGPRVILAGFVDGRGPFEAPTKVFADTEEEAKKVVGEYAAKGYVQLKIYSSVKPELVPVLIREAHAKGMRVSGHVPAHMIAEDAVNAGFDELQHINFVMLDLLSTREDDTRTPLRFTRIAEKGASLDLDAPATTAFLDLLAKKHTVIDPTLNVFEGMFTTRPDHPSETVAPILSRLPPQIQRSARSGALPVPPGMDATFHASFKKCEELVKRLWDRKITLVAGTDSWTGFALHRELELYSEAGIPNADVLALATLGAARVMRRDKSSGSIATGKDADLILVDGDPLAKMRDVRNVVLVVKGGTVIDAVGAQSALSIAPR